MTLAWNCVTWHDRRMRELSIRETRDKLSRVEELLEREGEVVITRRGRPVARLLTCNRKRRRAPSLAPLRASLPQMPQESETLLLEERDER